MRRGHIHTLAFALMCVVKCCTFRSCYRLRCTQAICHGLRSPAAERFERPGLSQGPFVKRWQSPSPSNPQITMATLFDGVLLTL